MESIRLFFVFRGSNNLQGTKMSHPWKRKVIFEVAKMMGYVSYQKDIGFFGPQIVPTISFRTPFPKVEIFFKMLSAVNEGGVNLQTLVMLDVRPFGEQGDISGFPMVLFWM